MKPRNAAVAVAAAVCLLVSREALSQGSWEFLGPGIGYQPTALCVTEHAVYVGMAENEHYSGHGLFRYRFAEAQWDLLAFGGSRITGIAVWGAVDETLVVARYDDTPPGRSYIMRSTDGGATWTSTFESAYEYLRGMIQAPSDPLHLIVLDSTWYSTNGGGTWAFSHRVDTPANIHGAAFDPANANVAYMTLTTDVMAPLIEKTTDGGANWSRSCFPCLTLLSGVAVNRSRTDQVMAGQSVSTDAGATWAPREAPFLPWAACSPPWAPGAFFVAGFSPDLALYQVWETWNLGETWIETAAGLPEAPGPGPQMIDDVLIGANPAEPDLYVTLEGSGVWRWTLAGASVPVAGGTADAATLSIFPNPVTDALRVRVVLPQPAQVYLDLYDIRGRAVARLCEGFLAAGPHEMEWGHSALGGSWVVSGIYTLRLEAGPISQQRKVMLIK